MESFLYEVIDSMFDFSFNLTNHIFSLYIADITRYYETILLTGNDSLPNAINFLIWLAFWKHHTSKASENVVWVHINTTTG